MVKKNDILHLPVVRRVKLKVCLYLYAVKSMQEYCVFRNKD